MSIVHCEFAPSPGVRVPSNVVPMASLYRRWPDAGRIFPDGKQFIASEWKPESDGNAAASRWLAQPPDHHAVVLPMAFHGALPTMHHSEGEREAMLSEYLRGRIKYDWLVKYAVPALSQLVGMHPRSLRGPLVVLDNENGFTRHEIPAEYWCPEEVLTPDSATISRGQAKARTAMRDILRDLVAIVKAFWPNAIVVNFGDTLEDKVGAVSPGGFETFGTLDGWAAPPLYEQPMAAACVEYAARQAPKCIPILPHVGHVPRKGHAPWTGDQLAELCVMLKKTRKFTGAKFWGFNGRDWERFPDTAQGHADWKDAEAATFKAWKLLA